MEFKEVVNKRHSVRNFKSDEISVTVLEDIVRTAQRSPSWENSQPWYVYIATGETLKKIKEIWTGKYEAKEELLAYIRKFMESSDEKELRQYRERVTRAFR